MRGTTLSRVVVSSERAELPRRGLVGCATCGGARSTRVLWIALPVLRLEAVQQRAHLGAQGLLLALLAEEVTQRTSCHVGFIDKIGCAPEGTARAWVTSECPCGKAPCYPDARAWSEDSHCGPEPASPERVTAPPQHGIERVPRSETPRVRFELTTLRLTAGPGPYTCSAAFRRRARFAGISRGAVASPRNAIALLRMQGGRKVGAALLEA
jgi:hypothetical protein